MHLLVTSPYLRDLIVTSLVVLLIGAWFLDSELSTCYSSRDFLGQENPVLYCDE